MKQGSEARGALEELYARLDERARAVMEAREGWPCRRGCDLCCRHLAEPLPVTALEWEYLWEGFQQLPSEAQAEVRARVEALRQSGAKRPYSCPLLDPATGGCRVYAHRPLMCRAYGFALSRGEGLWCHLIVDLLKRQGDDGIMWSNQDALEETVQRLGGPTLTFFEWFAAHPG